MVVLCTLNKGALNSSLTQTGYPDWWEELKQRKVVAKAPVTQADGKAQFVTTITQPEATPQLEETHEESGSGVISWACMGVTHPNLPPPQTHYPLTQNPKYQTHLTQKHFFSPQNKPRSVNNNKFTRTKIESNGQNQNRINPKLRYQPIIKHFVQKSVSSVPKQQPQTMNPISQILTKNDKPKSHGKSEKWGKGDAGEKKEEWEKEKSDKWGRGDAGERKEE